MKRPNLASRNHVILASCDAGAATLADCATAAGAKRPAATRGASAVSDKGQGNLRFMAKLLVNPLFPHKARPNSNGRGAMVNASVNLCLLAASSRGAYGRFRNAD